MKRSDTVNKILVFGILSAVISLVLACLGFGIVEFYKIKDDSLLKTRSQMDILAFNLQPTLLFDDKEAADKILLALQEDKSINRVRIYKADGREFTAFIHANKDGDIKLTKDIVYDHKPIGRLEIDSIY